MTLPAAHGDVGPWTGPGALDASYPAGTGPDGPVWAAVPLADGGLLIGGAFTHVDGAAVAGVARLKPNGALDPDYHAAVPVDVGVVTEVARLEDGRVLVGGDRVARLQANGSLDAGYQMATLSVLDGTKGFPDGQMIVWGTVGYGEFISRLAADGSEDPVFGTLTLRRRVTIFHIDVDLPGRVLSVVGRPGGGYHLMGDWNYLGDAPVNNLLTLNERGERLWALGIPTPATGELAVGADGRVVLATSSPGIGLYRRLPDGSPDPTFRTNTMIDGEGGGSTLTEPAVCRLSLQRNGKLLIAGSLAQVDGRVRHHVARLNEVGGLDETFDAGTGFSGPSWPNGDPTSGRRRLYRINQMVITPDDDIVVVGSFTGVQGVARPYLARLRGGELRQPPSVLTSPVSLTRNVGETARFDGVFSSFEPPTYQWFHGEQAVVGGTNAVLSVGSVSLADAGEYWVEVSNSVGSARSDRARLEVLAWTVPQVTLTPTNAHVAAGSNVVLQATATGVPLPTLQWQREGVDLPGATNSTLDLANLVPARAGRYRVLARSAGGEAASQESLIVVDDPPRPAPGRLDLGFYVELREAYPQPVFAMTLDGQGRLVFAQAYKNVVRVGTDGALDPTFNPGGGPQLAPGQEQLYCMALGLYAVAYGVRTIAAQPDGKLLLGGIFGQFDGRPAGGWVRLLGDGTIDPGFQAFPGATGGGWTEVSVLHPLPDGRLLAAGTFETVNGRPAGRVTRLLPDGTVDPQFHARGAVSHIPIAPCGTIQRPIGDATAVRLLAVQADGRFLIGGWFDTYGDASVPGFCRLESDGDLDTGLARPSVEGNVTAVSVGPGNTLVAAVERDENGRRTARVVRWRSDGRADDSFQSPTFVLGRSLATQFSESLRSLAVDTEGRVYVGGLFDVAGGNQTRRNVARLNSDGSLDATWGASGQGPDEVVRCLALDDDGNLIIGGFFSTVDGVPRQSLARLYGDRAAENGAPRIAGVARRGGNLEITVTTIAGSSYRLEQRRGLAVDSGWEMQTGILAGDGSAKTFVVPVGTESAVFWRVRRD